MTPGDEAWIQTGDIMHNKQGDVTLWDNAFCESIASARHRCRLRMLRNGQLELAVDPDDRQAASGVVSEGDYTVKHLTRLRPEDRWSWMDSRDRGIRGDPAVPVEKTLKKS